MAAIAALAILPLCGTLYGQVTTIRSRGVAVAGLSGPGNTALSPHGKPFSDAAATPEVPTRQSQPESGRHFPDVYKSLAQVSAEIDSVRHLYPELVHLDTIGQSTGLGLPIQALRISEHARNTQDKPRILFTGVHHAREPLGANICLEVARKLCAGYARDQRVRRWLRDLEIWIVPVVNPDGYKYIFDHSLNFPWWRKNLRDNDGDGRFNPLYDGVDLNRNYDFNWEEGGDGRADSWFYRGAKPFSENETRAILELTRRENFSIGISYHSYGESVLYPWGNLDAPPDAELIVRIASGMAAKIARASGFGSYAILPLDGRAGQSSNWMYGACRVIDFIVETGTTYFPGAETVPSIVAENLKGVYFLLDRMLGAGIVGHVSDTATGRPLRAELWVDGQRDVHVQPRRTDAHFGGFHLLLNPGTYTIEVRSEGYEEKIISGVRVRNNQAATLEVALARKPGYLDSTH